MAAAATTTQTPPHLAGMLALAVLATVAAGAVEVERGRAGASRCACSWPWRYLAVVLDGFSRRIVGWSMADHLRTELVLDAFDMAIAQRQPAPGLVHHTDHGCQPTSLAFGRRRQQAGLIASMGTVGDALDNAVAESFRATLECELLDRYDWATRQALRTAVFDFIEVFYNRQRRHSTLDHHTPVDDEHQRPSPVPVA